MPRHMEMNIHCAEYVIITCSHYVSGNSLILSNILVTTSWWQLSNLLFKTSLHLFFTFKKLSSTGLKWQSNSMDKTTEQDTGYISLKKTPTTTCWTNLVQEGPRYWSVWFLSLTSSAIFESKLFFGFHNQTHAFCNRVHQWEIKTVQIFSSVRERPVWLLSQVLQYSWTSRHPQKRRFTMLNGVRSY